MTKSLTRVTNEYLALKMGISIKVIAEVMSRGSVETGEVNKTLTDVTRIAAESWISHLDLLSINLGSDANIKRSKR